MHFTQADNENLAPKHGNLYSETQQRIARRLDPQKELSAKVNDTVKCSDLISGVSMCMRDTEADRHFLIGVTQNYLQRYLLCQYAQKERDREIKNIDRWTLLMIKCANKKKSFRYDTLLDLDVCAGKEEAHFPK